MRIADIETTIVRLPDVQAVGDGCQTILIIEVTTDEGITGIGEAHTSPVVSKAIIDAPLGSISSCGLRELIVGEDPRDINRLADLMYRRTLSYGRRGAAIHAISGIEIALWDILGKSVGQPVHRLLGGKRHDTFATYASFLAPGSAEEALSLAQRYLSDGFRAIKLGWGQLGANPAADIAMVGAIRRAVGSEVDIMLDMGFPVPLPRARYLANGLAEHGVYFLEEPLSTDDVASYGRLTETSPTPIAAGEKETTLYPFIDLMDRGGLRIIQPDVARVGGIMEAFRIACHAAARGVAVIPHCWSTDILVAATLQVMSTVDDCPYIEINVLDNPLRTDLITAPLRPRDGALTVPDAPGLGIELNRDTIDRYRWEPEGATR